LTLVYATDTAEVAGRVVTVSRIPDAAVILDEQARLSPISAAL
jgi:hypothetical protein